MASTIKSFDSTEVGRRRHRRGRVLLAASLCSAALLTALPVGIPRVAAVDVFSAPLDLSAAGGNASVPQVASDTTGDAVALWLRSDGTNDIVQAARYSPAVGSTPGSWAASLDLSVAGQNAVEPGVEIDDAGNATSIWRRFNGTNFIIQTRRYIAATATWGPTTDLSQTGGDARGPELSVDPAGNITAAWYRFDSTVFATVIETRRYLVATSTWTPKIVLSNAAFNSVISRVAADAGGNVIAIWRQDENADPVLETNIVYAARYSAGTNTWGVAVQLSAAGQSSSGIQVAVDSTGNATAIWARSDGTNQIVQTRRYDAVANSWGTAPSALSAPGNDAFGPRVGADNQGIVTAVWRRENTASKSIVQAARYFPSTGAWTPVTDLSADGQNAISPRLAVDPSGNVTAVWVRRNPTNFIVQSARLSLTTGTWGAATDLSQPGADGLTPQTDVNGDGNVVVVWARSNGTNTIVQASISAPVPGFTPVTPVRVFDTRPGESPLALRNVAKVKVGGGNVLKVKFADLTNSTPASGVAAVSMNLAVTNPVGPGFVTVYPCGERKEVASVNYVANQTVSNAVIAPLSSDGELCFYSLVDTDLVVDLNGWFPVGSSFTAVTPARVFDTRPGGSPDAIRNVVRSKVGPGNPLQVQVTGLSLAGGAVVTPTSGVGAVSLNVAITNPDADGFVTVFPCGARPFVASGNYVKSQTVSNAVIAPVPADGRICFYSLKPTDIVVDINGWFASGGGFVAAGPQRVFDTRAGQSPDALLPVTGGQVSPTHELKVKVIDLKVSDTQTITPPIGVSAVSLNVTAVTPTGDGFITVYPCGDRQLVASVNYLAGQIVPNAVIAPVSADGYVCFYSLKPADLVVDINGWFPTSS